MFSRWLPVTGKPLWDSEAALSQTISSCGHNITLHFLCVCVCVHVPAFLVLFTTPLPRLFIFRLKSNMMAIELPAIIGAFSKKYLNTNPLVEAVFVFVFFFLCSYNGESARKVPIPYFMNLHQSSKRFTFNKSYPNIITMVTRVPVGPATINTNCCSGWSLDRLLVMAIKDGAPSGEVSARAARFPKQIFHLRQQIKAKSLSVSSSDPSTTLKPESVTK